MTTDIVRASQTPSPPTPDKLWTLYTQYYFQDDKALDPLRLESRTVVNSLQDEFRRVDQSLNLAKSRGRGIALNILKRRKGRTKAFAA